MKARTIVISIEAVSELSIKDIKNIVRLSLNNINVKQIQVNVIKDTKKK